MLLQTARVTLRLVFELGITSAVTPVIPKEVPGFSILPRKGTCLAIYCYTVNAGCPLEETLAQGFPPVRRLAERASSSIRGVVAKRRDNVLDYHPPR
jgi:hypothetical protein